MGLIGEAVQELLESPCGLLVATVSADGWPRAARAWAADVVDASAGRLRVLVTGDDPVTLANLAEAGAVAVTGADVRTLQAVQVKGRVVALEPLTPADERRAARHTAGFFAQISEMDGIPVALLQRLVPRTLVGCVLEVDEVFDQSPGPGAGASLPGSMPRVRTANESPGPGVARLPDASGGADVYGGADGADESDAWDFDLSTIERCFGGAIPAALATSSGSGIPNVTYLSRAHRVDDERIALSNQFLSKTARNLAENQRASLLLIDPLTHDEFRLELRYERTERRGVVFDRLRDDVDALAVLSGMQDVFRLRSADIYRVLGVEQLVPNDQGVIPSAIAAAARRQPPGPTAVATLVARLARAQDLDGLVDDVVDGLVALGYQHVHLLLLDEEGRRLYTIASRGFDAESVGAEVELGAGMIGMAAARCAPLRVGNLLQAAKYSRSVRRAFEEQGSVGLGAREVPMPGLPGADSRIVVPAVCLGQLVGVLVAESTLPTAFTDDDEAVLVLVATVLAGAVEALRALDEEAEGRAEAVGGSAVPVAAAPGASGATVGVRFFPQDGSTFLDGEYLIKGVAGRILWSLLVEHQASGRTEFTNLEVRRNPSLDLPGFKDNFESRLILLKRRLDEREAPVRIERTGRGRFRLDVARPLTLTLADP